ncbi:hypothetical protein HPB50_020028 [Hyalomma asiaticum]|uniref:Uncharacterized protein n=1 Tax=Hyalomma asiaticum TaxID=266040 RepID=A0ACB7SHC2_HYAAI|nr:hypothetical protein HPB50_020028 [Hyalomma asiaticum]
MKETAFCLLLLLTAVTSTARNSVNATWSDRLESAVRDSAEIGNTTADNWDSVDYVQMLRDGLQQGFRSMPSSLKKKLLQADVRPECQVGLLRALRGFINFEPWALRLFDATGKYPSGLLQGSRVDMGAFDECLNTVQRDQQGNVRMRGQYCNLLFYVKDSDALMSKIDTMSDLFHPRLLFFKEYFAYKEVPLVRLGICFTDECSQADLQAIIDSVKPPQVIVDVSNCVTAEPEPWTTTQIGIVVFLGVILVIILTATTVDYVLKIRPKQHLKQCVHLQCLMAFSLTSNTHDLLKVADKARPDQHALQFLHGIRFLCIIHIVVGHFYTTTADTWSRLVNMFIASDEWTHMFATAGASSVDTFFFLSGFFLCLTAGRARSGPIPFILGIVKRLVRICAPLFFVIMCLCLLQQFVTGPDSKTFFQKLHDDVANHWWQLLLQIRNFYGNTAWDLLVHTWYLSSDFQLFVVALLTLMVFRGHKMALVAAFIVLSLLGCAVGTWVVAHYSLYPFLVFPSPIVDMIWKTNDYYYARPYYHAVCFFSGCLTFLLMSDFKERKITKLMQVAGWCVAVSCGLISVFAKFAWYRDPNLTSEAITLFAAFFDRILWSVLLIWITLACSSGRAGFVGRFLSWNAFVPLSKLSFGVYLIHLPFMQLMFHASRERVLWSKFNVITLWFAVLVWSFLLSYLLFIACEAPATKISNLILRRLVGRRDEQRHRPQEQTDESTVKQPSKVENTILCPT